MRSCGEPESSSKENRPKIGSELSLAGRHRSVSEKSGQIYTRRSQLSAGEGEEDAAAENNKRQDQSTCRRQQANVFVAQIQPTNTTMATSVAVAPRSSQVDQRRSSRKQLQDNLGGGAGGSPALSRYNQPKQQPQCPTSGQPTPRLPRGISRIPRGPANELQLANQQLPVCEAFIMTGQSMLKLSSDASNAKVAAPTKPTTTKSANDSDRRAFTFASTATSNATATETAHANEAIESGAEQMAPVASSQSKPIQQHKAATTTSNAAADYVRGHNSAANTPKLTADATSNNNNNSGSDVVAAHMSSASSATAAAVSAAASATDTAADPSAAAADVAALSSCDPNANSFRSKTFTRNDANNFDRTLILSQVNQHQQYYQNLQRARAQSTGNSSASNQQQTTLECQSIPNGQTNHCNNRLRSLESVNNSNNNNNNSQLNSADNFNFAYTTNQSAAKSALSLATSPADQKRDPNNRKPLQIATNTTTTNANHQKDNACSKSTFYIEYLKHIDSKSRYQSPQYQRTPIASIDCLIDRSNQRQQTPPINRSFVSSDLDNLEERYKYGDQNITTNHISNMETNNNNNNNTNNISNGCQNLSNLSGQTTPAVKQNRFGQSPSDKNNGSESKAKDQNDAEIISHSFSNGNNNSHSKFDFDPEDKSFKDETNASDMAKSQQQQPSSPDSLAQTPNSNTSFPACNDRESARRLAKRLYNLSGFKRSDVCHHLAKNNPFSQMVAEEFLYLFDFRSMKLDAALRKFLSKLLINGETQERERLLSKFSQRYYDCNKEKFPSSEAVQTLVCAMILLNTDLHGVHHYYGDKKNKKRTKLSLGAFIDGLNSSVAALSRPEDNLHTGSESPGFNPTPSTAKANNNMAGYTFPRHLLVDLYESVKKRPLKCGDDKCDMSSLEAELDRIYSQQVNNGRSNTLPTRRMMFGAGMSSTLSGSSRRLLRQGRLDGNDSETAVEFKSGFLNRKRIFDARGKPTGKGNRGWRRFNVVLQDLRLIMLPSSSSGDSNKNITTNSSNNDKNPKQIDERPTAKQLARVKSQTLDPDFKNTARIHHSIAKKSSNYVKREFVFQLRLADQSEYLFQASDEQDMNAWIDTINFASACLSSPALPSAVCSNNNSSYLNGNSNNVRRKLQQDRLNRRAILSAAYTRLSYWEQLLDHEEYLKRLNTELDEHLDEATKTCNANKRSKTEFIERIAYLKHEIERYTIYVELMRRKSNSPEAIILSKHPQIASLTPSNEMIKSLPLSSNTSPKSSPITNRRMLS